MNLTKMEKFDPATPGPYWFQPPGDQLPVVVCTNGHQSRIGPVHSIAPDGRVAPSFICATSGCYFHEWIVLEGFGPATA